MMPAEASTLQAAGPVAEPATRDGEVEQSAATSGDTSDESYESGEQEGACRKGAARHWGAD